MASFDILMQHVVAQKPQNTTISNPQQMRSERDGNGKQGNTKSQGKIESMARDMTARGSNVFDARGGGIRLADA